MCSNSAGRRVCAAKFCCLPYRSDRRRKSSGQRKPPRVYVSWPLCLSFLVNVRLSELGRGPGAREGTTRRDCQKLRGILTAVTCSVTAERTGAEPLFAMARYTVMLLLLYPVWALSYRQPFLQGHQTRPTARLLPLCPRQLTSPLSCISVFRSR